MPYKSKAQQRYLHWAKPEGVNLKKWDKETDFKNLPERAKAHKKKIQEKKHTKKTASVAEMFSHALGGSILGGGLGAGAGAIMAPEGKGWEGARRGALVGAGIGALKQPLSARLRFGNFTTDEKLMEELAKNRNLASYLGSGLLLSPLATIGGGVAGKHTPEQTSYEKLQNKLRG